MVTIVERLKVAEDIMGELFAETDDAEVFKKYCALCREDGDCDWGDNFPDCLDPKRTRRTKQ